MRKRWLAAMLSAAMVLSAVPAYPAKVQAAENMTIEAENYVSSSGTVKVMKSGSASEGSYVGDFDNLDCLSYRVEVEKAGNYKVLLRVGTERNGGRVMVNNNGSFSEEAAVPNTGNWQNYQEVEVYLWLESGTQIVTVSNIGSTWNLDKLTFSYIDSEKDTADLKLHNGVYLENRWKKQRIVERDGVLQYADTDQTDYDSSYAQWNLIPDGEGYYEIQNAASKKYLVMTEGSQEVSLAADGNMTAAGKWQVGVLGGRLEFFNGQYRDCCINVEYQSEHPGKIMATSGTLAKWYSAQWEINTPAESHTYTIGADRIEGTAGTAVSTDGKSITVNQNGSERSWTLSEDLSAAPVFTAENMPMMEAVYNLSMEETLLNINNGAYGDVFWTGTNWHKVWTRDTAMAVQYSLAWIFPEETKNSILEKIIGGNGSPQVWEEDTGTGGSYPSSVDRIIMEIAGWELYKTTGDKEWLAQIYDISKNTLEQDYHVAYDKISGLFKGETGGLDHRSKTYPDWMDENEQDSIINIAESKAANANIIFAQALNIMAESARILGKDESEIADWEKKYENLKQEINDHFWLEDRGMYSSWEYPEYMGSPVADKVDVIANGYALMFDIADEEQKQQIMENYPLVVYGADTVWPQKNGRQASTIYHNRGVWPGWEATLMIGAKENGNLQLAEEIMKSCVRGAGMSLTNKEVINFETGEGICSDRQLWSIAGTLAGYYRILFGMEYGLDGISFKPYVPEWMEGPYSLKNYAYRNAVLNMTVEGKGDTLAAITVNGEEKPLDYVLPTDAEGTYDIVMKVTDSGKRSKIHLEKDSWVVCPDLPVLTENADGTLTWEEKPEYTYKLWNGERFEEVSGGSYTPDREVYGAYSLVAVDKNGITSEMSKPVIVSPENSKIVYEAEDGEYQASNFEAVASGYTGTGYVVDNLAKKTDLCITVNAPKTGRYQISMIYNNYGDPTSGQDGGIRSVYIDGKDAGTMVFPIVKYDFQQGSHLFVNLKEGPHTVEIRYNKDDWYDTNMTTCRGRAKNDISYDSLSLQYLGELPDALYRESLEKLIAAAEALDAKDYAAETWEEMAKALAKAKAVAADENAARAQIDLAAAEMVKAFGKLEYAVQKVHLETAIAVAEKILVLENNYDAADAADLKMAVEAGKAVYEKEGATQEETDAAAYAILDALARLSKTADVNSLESLLAAAKELDKDKYTKDSVEKLEEAIRNAEAVLADPERDDSAISEAYTEIIDAIIGLKMRGNKAALHAMIVKAESVLAQAEVYVEDTLAGMETALASAKAVYDDADALQKEIDEAVEALTLEVAEARLIGDVDGDGLVTTSDAAELLKASAEFETLSKLQAESADVNGDGIADTEDAAVILQYAAEKISEF